VNTAATASGVVGEALGDEDARIVDYGVNPAKALDRRLHNAPADARLPVLSRDDVQRNVLRAPT
jgi:hypothetical protein